MICKKKKKLTTILKKKIKYRKVSIIYTKFLNKYDINICSIKILHNIIGYKQYNKTFIIINSHN